MKKSVLVLCAMLVCGTVGTSVSAAETETAAEAAAKEGWQLYTSSASELYSMEIPEDFFEMNSETIDEMINTYGEEFFASAGLDVSSLGEIDYSNTDYIYSSDMVGNINVQITKESQLEQAMLEEYKEMLDEQIKSTYLSIGVPEENCEAMDVEEIAGITFYRYGVEFGGQTMHQYMTCNEDTDMLTITFTNIDEETEKSIMESFKLL